VKRRRLLLGACLAVCAPAAPALAQIDGEGIRVLGREKSLAEQFLVLLNDFGRKDVAQYAQGITLYAQAKADFDGLISELEHTLDQSQPPDQSAEFRAALEEAVRKRVAFTDYITGTVLVQTDGTRSGIGDYIKVVPDLVKALTDAGISIWREFHANGEAKRKELRQELETLRWPPFKP